MTALSADQRESASPETGNALLRLCHRIDLTASLGQVRAPTLVVHREHDRAAPLEQTQLMASGIPGAHLEVLPGRSHLPYVGDTDRLVKRRGFLSSPLDLERTGPER